MDAWKLEIGQPLNLTLAADARLSNLDYVNDQIWKLHLAGGEPPALALSTTYGLRARSMRLFPRFTRANLTLSDPNEFFQQPRIEKFYPNYLMASCMPFAGIRVNLEYWAPESHAVAGRVRLISQTVLKENLRMEWVCQLNPLGDGQSMAAESVGINAVMSGRTADLHPVFFLTGGPAPSGGPYPGLTLDLELFPGAERQFNWALASLTDPSESFQLARQVSSRSWEAEIARLELTNDSQQLHIETGDPDWNAALAFAQKAANNLRMPSSQRLPNPSFVLAREPEHGRSIRGDGSDYPYVWNGQTVFDAFSLANLLLPGSLSYLKGVVENFLAVQEENGAIDWKPGIAGQRSQQLAQPMLAQLVARIVQASPNDETAWLRQLLPGLEKFLRQWLSPLHDRDGDGFPEWDHPVQSGLEEIPLFDRWHPFAQGVPASMVETPALACLLQQECLCLAWLAQQAGQDEPVDWLNAQAEKLSRQVEGCWSRDLKRYAYRDRDTHATHSAEQVLVLRAAGKQTVRRSWVTPRRLLLRLLSGDQSTLNVIAILRGIGPAGPVEEKLTQREFYWSGGTGRATTQSVFIRLDEVELITQSQIKDGWIATIDYTQEDISLYLPLWAGVVPTERAQELIETCLLPRVMQPFGIATCPPNGSPGPEYLAGADFFWNQFIAEGLLRYGYRSAAADLFSRLMHAAINSLKDQQAFRSSYHAAAGNGFGDFNPLHGLPPISLFLNILGLKKISASQVILEGINPFPWPVSINYRGINIQFTLKETLVRFPSGQTVSASGPGPHFISLPPGRS